MAEEEWEGPRMFDVYNSCLPAALSDMVVLETLRVKIVISNFYGFVKLGRLFPKTWLATLDP